MAKMTVHSKEGRRCFVLLASGQDDEYLERGTLVAIRSIRTTNPHVDICVLHHDLNESQQRMFGDVSLVPVPSPDFEMSGWSRHSRPDLPTACFLTVCVERLVDYDIAIYVDADAVVLEPLDDLFAFDAILAARVMDDHPLHEHFENGEELLRTLNIKPSFAFNNGVMRFNLRYWRSHGLVGEALRLYAAHGPETFRYTDQSLINLIAYKTGTLTPIPRIYNFARYPDMLLMEHTIERNHLGYLAPVIAEGVVKVVHWTGPMKPWSSEARALDDVRATMCMACYTQFER
jgi:lipopolysaccharide biosynthesis glycosyltransferase